MRTTNSWRTGLGGFTVVRSGQLVSSTGTLRITLALTFWSFDPGMPGRETVPAEAMS